MGMNNNIAFIDVEGNCEYTEQAVAASRKGTVLQLGG
jgi:hypothetical protein